MSLDYKGNEKLGEDPNYNRKEKGRNTTIRFIIIFKNTTHRFIFSCQRKNNTFSKLLNTSWACI